MWGIDRKIRPEDYYMASRGLPSDARLWSRGTYFLSTPHTQDGFFFLQTFHFWTWIFNNAVSLIANVRRVTFSDVIKFTDVNLNDGIHDVLYNQCISKHVRILDFYLTLGRITWVG